MDWVQTKRSLYEEMGVSMEATTSDIQRAFRRRARIVHPDKSGSNTQDFVRLSYARDVLTNPRLRRAYDMYGASALPENVDESDVALFATTIVDAFLFTLGFNKPKPSYASLISMVLFTLFLFFFFIKKIPPPI